MSGIPIGMHANVGPFMWYMYLLSLKIIILDKCKKLKVLFLFHKCDNTIDLHVRTKYIAECKPGLTGINCTSLCPYPTYGNRCQEICSCSNETCDVKTGCINRTTGTSHIYVFRQCLFNQ